MQYVCSIVKHGLIQSKNTNTVRLALALRLVSLLGAPLSFKRLNIVPITSKTFERPVLEAQCLSLSVCCFGSKTFLPVLYVIQVLTKIAFFWVKLESCFTTKLKLAKFAHARSRLVACNFARDDAVKLSQCR